MATVEIARRRRRHLSRPRRRARAGVALGLVARHRRGALELGARLVGAAELGEQVAAHARQQVVAGAAPARRAARRRSRGRPRARTAMPTATARLSSTTGDGATCGERGVERGDARPVGRLGAARRAHGRRRSRPAARRDRGAAERLGSAPARRGRGGSAAGPSARGPARAAAPAGRRASTRACGARGLQLHQRDQAVHLGSRPAPARRACGRGAAPRRTAPAASSRRRRSPSSPR